MGKKDLDRPATIRFYVSRGGFEIPVKLREEEPEEWARLFASSVPPGTTVSSYRQGGLDVFTWRRIFTEVTDD